MFFPDTEIVVYIIIVVSCMHVCCLCASLRLSPSEGTTSTAWPGGGGWSVSTVRLNGCASLYMCACFYTVCHVYPCQACAVPS